MKRLPLEAFKTKRLNTPNIDQLLGQVLGNCNELPKQEPKGGKEQDPPLVP